MQTRALIYIHTTTRMNTRPHKRKDDICTFISISIRNRTTTIPVACTIFLAYVLHSSLIQGSSDDRWSAAAQTNEVHSMNPRQSRWFMTPHYILQVKNENPDPAWWAGCKKTGLRFSAAVWARRNMCAALGRVARELLSIAPFVFSCPFRFPFCGTNLLPPSLSL